MVIGRRALALKMGSGRAVVKSKIEQPTLIAPRTGTKRAPSEGVGQSIMSSDCQTAGVLLAN